MPTLQCRALLSLVLLSSLAIACDDDPGDTSDDSGTQADAGSCVCTDPAAQMVTYDPEPSGLASDNVQEALDELAMIARADVLTRINRIQQPSESGPGVEVFGTTATCPGEQDVALGGSCDGSDDSAVMISTILSVRSFTCSWRKPIDLTVSV